MGSRDWLARRFGGRDDRAPSLTTWGEVERSELFGWFGVHETGRTPLSDGGAEVRLEPGGSQEFIDLRVRVGEDGGVRDATLTLVRSWVDDPASAPFAVDFTKSALPILAPRSALVRAFAERLEREWRGMEVLMRAGSPPSEPTAPAVEVAVDVYRGRGERAELADDAARLTLVNRSEGGVPSLVMTLEHA